VKIVPLVEDLALDVGIQLPEAPNLLVLACDEFLRHRRDLDVDIVFWHVEVWLEELRRFTGVVPFDWEFSRLVLPVNTVEIEESRELPFAVVGEVGELCP